MSPSSRQIIEQTELFGAHNYAPLPVVIERAENALMWDVEGKRYIDFLSGYSALNFGHRNPRIQAVAHRQLDRLTLTSRAFFNDQFGSFCEKLAKLCGQEMVLAMNSGAEAVETALKAARRWGYQVKGVPADRAEIIVCADNFAGRTISIISFSTVEEYRQGFGPFTPGFKVVPYGDAAALRAAITPNTVGFLFEPIQGEGGIIIPPYGYLKEVRQICDQNRVLMIADEIQTGLCRTGEVFACDHEQVRPDICILGKSLGGGITPISAVIGSRAVLGLFEPGSHGSTFGGNAFACAIACEVIDLINEEKPQVRSRELGKKVLQELVSLKSPHVSAIRGRGLFIGIDIKHESGSAKDFCKKFMHHGVLCKDTRKQTIRLAPPLTIPEEQLVEALKVITSELKN